MRPVVRSLRCMGRMQEPASAEQGREYVPVFWTLDLCIWSFSPFLPAIRRRVSREPSEASEAARVPAASHELQASPARMNSGHRMVIQCCQVGGLREKAESRSVLSFQESIQQACLTVRLDGPVTSAQ